MSNKLSLSRITPLLIFSVIFTVLRIPSLIEPYWYGDEGIYAVIGQAIRNGSLLYKDIWDNKPPLLYLIYAFANGNLFWVKLISLVVGLGTIGSFYYFALKIFKTKRSVYVSTGLFSILFGLPLLEGNIANAENFMLLPVLLAAILIFYTSSSRAYFLAGIFLSCALMLKIVAIFDIAAFLIVLFIRTGVSKHTAIDGIKYYFSKVNHNWLLLGICILPVITLIFYSTSGSVSHLFSSVFAQNVDYVGANNHFIFPLGWIALKIIMLMVSVFLIFYYRKKMFVQETLILTWMAFALFSIFFSDRPYTHYVLMGIIPFSLLVGYLFEKFKLYLISIMCMVIMLVVSFFPVYNKTIHYYENYVRYLIAKKSTYEYIGFFDKYAVRDYILAESIRSITSTKNTEVYFWSDSAQLYILTGTQPVTKYIVAYHALMYSEAMKETIVQIRSKSPQYIISTKGNTIPQDLLIGYTVKYIIEGAIIYEKNN
jgi:hypothetical protein